VDVLGVDPEAPLVSATVAEQMARGVAQCMHADVALATTGAAGPDGHGGVPPGTVVIATCVDGDVRCMEHHYDDHDDPATVVELAARDAITVLANALAAGRHGSVSVDTGTRARHAERR
jgi:nicotinamide-nucleotide amidase